MHDYIIWIVGIPFREVTLYILAGFLGGGALTGWFVFQDASANISIPMKFILMIIIGAVCAYGGLLVAHGNGLRLNLM